MSGRARKRFEAFSECAVVQAAVGARSGEIEINVTRESSHASVLSPVSAVFGSYGQGSFDIVARERVQLRTLDSIVAEMGLGDIGLVKIDVQGMELDVLRGGTETLNRAAAVLIEINYVPHYYGASPFSRVHSALECHGFMLFGVSAPYIGQYHAMWADALYVNKRRVSLAH